jgi:hypothetical protein
MELHDYEALLGNFPRKVMPPPQNGEPFPNLSSVAAWYVSCLNAATHAPPMADCTVMSAELAHKLDDLLSFILFTTGNGEVTLEVKQGKIRFAKISVSVQA